MNKDNWNPTDKSKGRLNYSFEDKWEGLRVDELPDIRKKAQEVNLKDKARSGRYLDFGSPELNAATLGYEYHTFFIPAPPNLGKSTLQVNISSNLILNNEDVQVLDLSYDDAFDARFRLHIARLARIPINWVKYPNFDAVTDDARTARDKAMAQWAQQLMPQLQIIDRTELDSQSRMLSNLEKLIWYYKDVYRGKKLVVMIDGLHDIYADNHPFGSNASEAQLQGWISDRLKTAAEDAEVSIIATAQVAKISDRRGGSAFSIKGNGKTGYDAHLVGTVYSDYKINRGNAEIWHDVEYAYDPGNTYRQPVIELDISKSKVSEYSNIIFFKHYQSFGLVEEASQSWQEHWREIVYGSSKRKPVSPENT